MKLADFCIRIFLCLGKQLSEEFVNDDTPCLKCGKYDQPQWVSGQALNDVIALLFDVVVVAVVVVRLNTIFLLRRFSCVTNVTLASTLPVFVHLSCSFHMVIGFVRTANMYVHKRTRHIPAKIFNQ